MMGSRKQQQQQPTITRKKNLHYDHHYYWPHHYHGRYTLTIQLWPGILSRTFIRDSSEKN